MSESEGVVDRGGLSDARGESGVEDSGSIPLNIRSPAASFQDIRLDCPGVWTITMLKQKISQTLNFKVSPKKQRLVYAGKILEDEDQLNNVIRFQDECSVYTILLVSSQPPQKVIKPKDNSESSRMLMPESSTNIPPVPSNPVTTAGTNLELNSWASEYLQLSNQIQERGESSEQGNNNTTPEEERTPDTEVIEQGQEALNVQANVPPPDTLTTVSTFIMSFFTSLLPEPPQQLVD